MVLRIQLDIVCATFSPADGIGKHLVDMRSLPSSPRHSVNMYLRMSHLQVPPRPGICTHMLCLPSCSRGCGGHPLPCGLVPGPSYLPKAPLMQLPPHYPAQSVFLPSACNYAVISLYLNNKPSLDPTFLLVTTLFLCSLYSEKSP